MKFCIRVKQEVYKVYFIEAENGAAAEDQFAQIVFDNEDPGRTLKTKTVEARVDEITDDLAWDEWGN